MPSKQDIRQGDKETRSTASDRFSVLGSLPRALHEHIRPGFEARKERLGRLLDAVFGDHPVDGDVHAFARVVGLLDSAGQHAAIGHDHRLVWRRNDIADLGAAHADAAIGLGAIQPHAQHLCDFVGGSLHQQPVS